MTSIHALHIPAGRRTVAVDVVGELARLEIRRAPGTSREPDDGTALAEPLLVTVPARALVAAVRAAWADVHDARTFEPWRDHVRDHRNGPWDPDDEIRPGDLGDGDPDGFYDSSVVPFPHRFPVQPPRPPRSGQPWEPEEETTVRERWLAASPDAHREGLLAEIAQAVERKAGGVVARLPRLGCDPYRPGCTLDRTWDGPPGGAGGSGAG